jgi:hypothetical protein
MNHFTLSWLIGIAIIVFVISNPACSCVGSSLMFISLMMEDLYNKQEEK